MSKDYMRFINMMQAVKEATPAWPELDAVEDKLLQLLTAKWHASEEITVLDALKLNNGLSESTIQRRLITLQTKGVVKLDPSNKDGRSKLVVPTQLTIDYFSKLDVCLRNL